MNTESIHQARRPASISVGIVADSNVVCSALREVIGEDPELVVVGTASDFEAGLALIETQALHVIVMSLALASPGGRPSGLDFITRAKQVQPSLGVLSLKRGTEEASLRAALEAGASACCLTGTPQARLVRAIKAVSVGGTWLDPELSEVIFRSRRTAVDLIPYLTARERVVLQLITEGCTNAQMAALLGCATGTVHTHVVNIFEKLGVHDRVSAAVYALRKGLITENYL